MKQLEVKTYVSNELPTAFEDHWHYLKLSCYIMDALKLMFMRLLNMPSP